MLSASPIAGGATIGLYDPAATHFYLAHNNDSATLAQSFGFAAHHLPGNWQPLAGNWDGNGDTIGFYDPARNHFYLASSNSANPPSVNDVGLERHHIPANWKAIVGDWDGDGEDTIGLYDPVHAHFYLAGSNDSNTTAQDFGFEQLHLPGNWIPIAGNWSNTLGADGEHYKDTIGFYDPARATFYLADENSGDTTAQIISYADLHIPANWKPIYGDWNPANDGDEFGLYDPARGHFYLAQRRSVDAAVQSFGFEQFNLPPTWVPLAGQWQSSSALLAAGGTLTTGTLASLTQQDLLPIVAEAVRRWTATGLNDQQQATLAGAQVAIADLQGSELGEASGNTITIDRDAAGRGWFIDATPRTDEEFQSNASGIFTALDPRAVDRIDLLTVVEHELGHVLGLSDLAGSGNDAMVGSLQPGVRRIPSGGAADVGRM